MGPRGLQLTDCGSDVGPWPTQLFKLDLARQLLQPPCSTATRQPLSLFLVFPLLMGQLCFRVNLDFFRRALKKCPALAVAAAAAPQRCGGVKARGVYPRGGGEVKPLRFLIPAGARPRREPCCCVWRSAHPPALCRPCPEPRRTSTTDIYLFIIYLFL